MAKPSIPKGTRDFSPNEVATLDQEFNTNLYITSRIGYQVAFGSGNFAKPKNFTDFVLSLGVTIKGDL